MNQKQKEAIEKHGRALLAIFPNATEKDPVKLCKKLRRIETAAHRKATAYCNGEIDSEQWAGEKFRAICKLARILLPDDSVPVIVNGDPRGYALKIESEWTRANSPDLYRDWGGYGIIAPDLTA